MKKINYKKEGNRFHKKIENLLRKSGAEIIKSDFNAKGSDIIIKFDDSKILCQCKFSPENKKIQNLDNLINSYSRKVQKEKAKAAILIFGNYQVPEVYIQKRGKIISKDKVAIWTDKTVKSYQNLADSIGKFAKYQILGDLNINNSIKSFKVDAMKVKQMGFEFCLAKLTPSFLLKSGYVARRVEDPKSYQRYITKKRVTKQIPSYIKNELGIFPNSVILVSSYPLKYVKGKLTLRNNPSSLWILDGQHRVYAFANVPEIEIRNNYELICAIFDGRSKKMDHNSQAQLFVKINNEAKKVPSSLITDLAKSFEGLDFHKRQINLMKRLSRTGMFIDKFKSYQSKKGVLNPTTFCTNQSMMKLTREGKGVIFKSIRELSDKKEEDRAYIFLKDYFKIVSQVFKKEWNNSKKFVLSTDKGIRGLLNLYERILKYTKYRNNQKKIKEVIKALKKSKPELRNSELKNQYLGEGGARDLAEYWAAKINETILQFDKNLSASKVQGQIIETLSIYNKKDRDKAIEFVLKTFKNYFDGRVMGELMHIDKTTFRYIRELSYKCKKIHLCFQDIRSEDKKKCGELLKGLKDKGIEIVLTKKQVHERWLGTDKYLLMLNTDLKNDAISSKKHTKELLQINRNNEKISNFKKDWNYYRKMEGDVPKYDYSPNGS
jgi:DGQHR domain-containing protein